MRLADCVLPASVPEMVEVVLVVTAEVEMTNVAVVAPALTVTDEGNVADPRLEERATTIPVPPAGPFKVTVPVEVPPPTTVDGETVKLVSTGGVIVRRATAEELVPMLAVMVGWV